MNLFNSLRIYAGKWSVKESRSFSDEEKQSVEEAYVVSSQYGYSVCFLLKSGGQTFIPLDSNSSLGEGEAVDMDKAVVLTLSKEGEADIYRVSI